MSFYVDLQICQKHFLMKYETHMLWQEFKLSLIDLKNTNLQKKNKQFIEHHWIKREYEYLSLWSDSSIQGTIAPADIQEYRPKTCSIKRIFVNNLNQCIRIHTLSIILI